MLKEDFLLAYLCRKGLIDWKKYTPFLCLNFDKKGNFVNCVIIGILEKKDNGTTIWRRTLEQDSLSLRDVKWVEKVL